MFLVNVLIFSNLIINNNFINDALISTSLKNITNFQLSQNVEKSNIGIIDFRKILRDSNAMKNLGKIFVDAEKKINYELNMKQIELKKKEKLIIKNKKNFTKFVYQSKLKLFKEEVYKVQNYDIK
ncbi:hypothetical protein N9O69_06215, partial [Alphaproteobacteria bacterium]|nr:hypothetical protein [Alphaproteobacteria bacterium]